MHCDNECCERVCSRINFSSLTQCNEYDDNVLWPILLNGERESAVEKDGEGLEEFSVLLLMLCAFIYSKHDIISCLANI